MDAYVIYFMAYQLYKKKTFVLDLLCLFRHLNEDKKQKTRFCLNNVAKIREEKKIFILEKSAKKQFLSVFADGIRKKHLQSQVVSYFNHK